MLRIEALTMLDMVWKDILPAVSAYSKQLAETALSKKELGLDCSFEKDLATRLTAQMNLAALKARTLEYAMMDVKTFTDSLELARYYRDAVLRTMNELRIVVDELETNTASAFWPYPSYGDILFSVN